MEGCTGEHTFFLSLIEERKDLKYQPYVLHFCDKNDNEYRTYAPSCFIEIIRKNRASDERPVFRYHGIEPYYRNIAYFEIIYKKEHKFWNIFQ